MKPKLLLILSLFFFMFLDIYPNTIISYTENFNQTELVIIMPINENDEAINSKIDLALISLIFSLLGVIGLIWAYIRSIKNQKQIAKQNQLIEKALKEKDSLLREIHHRVKNNLQMISSLLSLQSRNTKNEAVIMALEQGKGRIKAMPLIHQKLYQNNYFSFIEMQGYIESLLNSVQSAYRKGGHAIDITIDTNRIELDVDRAIPLGLILNELVSNTFKYAFPHGDDKAKIHIHLSKDQQQYYFEYADNGIGLPTGFNKERENIRYEKSTTESRAFKRCCEVPRNENKYPRCKRT